MSEQTGQALERRTDLAPAQVAPVPMPRELQELGVRIGVNEETGTRIVFLPDELRKRVNVVNPTTSYVAVDPNWTPGISVVKLDVERDTYDVNGKRGLSKQALETLSKAAGVLYTRTARVPRDELQDGELWAYRATVGFRRSDGTIDEVTRERGFNAEAEKAEIEDAVANAKKYRDGQRTNEPKFATPEAREAEVRKRWLNELRFGPAKTESKAINRALRAGLSIPTSLSRQDAQKPFLVVGYNFTPDYNDPEIKRALVSVGLNAQAAIYGGRDVSPEMPQLEAGDIDAAALEAGTPAEETTPADEPAAEAADVAGPGEQASDAEPETAASEVPRSEEEEPSLEDDATSYAAMIPDEVIEAAGDAVVRGDLTVRDVVARGAKGRDWLAWALRNLPEEDERLGQIRVYLEAREPELWAEIVPGEDS